jgi:hypothetical protein
MASTLWPFRQALSDALRQIILAAGVPAINASLSSLMLASGVAAGEIPAFGDESVTIGDLAAVSQPTLCIVKGERQITRIATGTFLATFTTEFRLKTPWVADNAPEDFDLISTLACDNLCDLLTSEKNRVIVPVNDGGQNVLPAGQAFYGCYYVGDEPQEYPQKAADGITTYAGWIMYHTASLNYAAARPDALGG